MDDAQKEFDDKYITSTEICEKLNVDRSTVLNARRRGFLPNPIKINGVNIFIWRRLDIQKSLDAWELTLTCRRGGGL